jgi:hypothetical protein
LDGTVEATVPIVLKGPTKLCGDLGFAAADCTATTSVTIATPATSKPFALDPEIARTTAERMTTSIRSVSNQYAPASQMVCRSFLT